MANWSYNGVILPNFPTDFGEYTDNYKYRIIQWSEEEQWYNALISDLPFQIREGQYGPCIYCQNRHGNYYMPATDLSAWQHVGDNYDGHVVLHLRNGNRLVWADHDIINRMENDSVYMMASDPVSPGSIITGIWLNAAKLELKRGESFQFVPSVTGTGIYSKRVLYTLSGNDDHGGTTLSPDGLLTVGEKEYVSSFKVTVAAQQDPSMTYTVSVTVTDRLYKLQAGLATDLYDYNGVHLPEYPTDFGQYTGNYKYRIIQWSEEEQWYNALVSDLPFQIWEGQYGPCVYCQNRHGNYYMPAADTSAWRHVGDNYDGHVVLHLKNGNRLVWADHDIINRMENDSVYMRAGTPVKLCVQSPAEGGAEAQFVGSSVCVNASCVDLNTTEEVYTVKAWLYKQTEGLNTTLPPTYTSTVFGGPTWKEQLRFSGLEPYTAYGIYAVVCVDGVATDHLWQEKFSTLQADIAAGLTIQAEQVTEEGFTLAITRSGLEAALEYTAEVIVYHPESSRVAFEGEISFFGSGTDRCTVTGLATDIRYAVSVDIYPAPAGAVVLHGDLFVTTTAERTDWGIYAGVSGVARPVREIYVGVNGRARRVKGVYLGVNGRAQPLKGK